MAGWLRDYLGTAAEVDLRPRDDPGEVLAVIAGPRAAT